MHRFRILLALLLAIAPAVHAAPPSGRAVALTTADGVKVHGTWRAIAKPRATVLLFHQAGASRAEYYTIAPRLNALGYATLAIDQRSGGTLFGPNRTAAELGREASYIEARRDLEAAIAWARPRGAPLVPWGSSYSASLVFLVAADHPRDVAAIVSFSPGEYLGNGDRVRRAATHVRAPAFIASARDDEAVNANMIFRALPPGRHVRFVPKSGGVHGSSALIAGRNPQGAGETWAAVERFLAQTTRMAGPGTPSALSSGG